MFDDGLELGYAAGPAPLRAAFAKNEVVFQTADKKVVLEVDGLAPLGLGFYDLPTPVRPLPFWIPPERRRVGEVLYDDGEGSTHDRGKRVYALASEEKWKGFEALGLSCRFQGMRPEDHWTLEAFYDRASGFLLAASVRTSIGERARTAFEMVLASSTEAEMKRKLG